MGAKLLLTAVVLLLSLGFGYYAFVYRPQEIKTKCLELASYNSTPTKGYMGIESGSGKEINEDLYKRCLAQ